MLHRCPAALLLVTAFASTDAFAAQVFVHTASPGVTKGDKTQLRHPAVDGQRDARVFVSQVYGSYLPAPVGVVFRNGRWSIATMNKKPIPHGTQFNVLVLPPDAPGAFQHRATKANIRANQTVLEHPAIKGNPRVMPIVTPVLGPRQSDPLGVWWNGSQWTIYNQDRKAMRAGALFNVLVAGRGGSPAAWDVRVHKVTGATKRHNAGKHISALGLKNNNAKLFVTQAYGKGTPYNTNDIGLWFDRGEWWVFNESRAELPDGLLINVLSVDPAQMYAPNAPTGRPTVGLKLPGAVPGKGRPVDPGASGNPGDDNRDGRERREGRRGKGERFGPIQIQAIAKQGVCLHKRPRAWGPSQSLMVKRCMPNRGGAQGFIYHRGRNVIRAYDDPTKCLWASRAGLVYFDTCRNKSNPDDKRFVFDTRNGVIRSERDPSMCLRASDGAFRDQTPVVLGKCTQPPRDATSWRCRRTPNLPSIERGMPDAQINAFCSGR
ncbi:MAG: ricin-type beta-trefoil lectin domain protein [Deltaproteobacteria bacterium]|jgi:hypothetical protein